MLRSQVLKLYHDMLRMVYQIPDKKQRAELQHFIRQDFDNNRHIQDEVCTKKSFLFVQLVDILRGKARPLNLP